MNNGGLMVETMTVGGETILVSYREARLVERSLERGAERSRVLRREWYAANGLEEGADPFAVFES